MRIHSFFCFKEFTYTFKTLLDQYEKCREFLRKTHNECKKSYGSSLKHPKPNEDGPDGIFRKICDLWKLNKNTRDNLVDIHVFTFNAFFDLKRLRNFLETSKSDCFEQINVN